MKFVRISSKACRFDARGPGIVLSSSFVSPMAAERPEPAFECCTIAQNELGSVNLLANSAH